ncbi:MAG TPA: serine/threonine-protein kinase, partial [Kofleriaceae bacterium]|nr:serine/threonine-protein kinase [Kofleriaceae bacterium]
MAALTEQLDLIDPNAALTERDAKHARPRRRTKPATLSQGDKVGAWRVEGELGKGGMGTVYAVTHAGFGKRAALKLCHRSVLSEQFTVETFLREARVVHLVNHPGVCDVFATGTYDGRPYLAMERLHGKTLGDYLEHRAVTKVEALDLLVDIARVLHAAHAAGVVHRDLKLDNVFVVDAPGAPPQIKVLDWGVARILGEPDPMTGMIAGTLTYVPPEQVHGDELTPAADIYSLGVLAYQLLLGEPPFKNASDLALIRMHLEAAPPRPSVAWAEIPASLEMLLLAMLAKNPAERPTVDDVIAGITAARGALLPRRPGVIERLRLLPKAPSATARSKAASRTARSKAASRTA